MNRYGIRCVACLAERMVTDLPVALAFAYQDPRDRRLVSPDAQAFIERHVGHTHPPEFVTINGEGQVLGQCSGLPPVDECLQAKGHEGLCSLAPETAMRGAYRRGW